MWIVRKLTFFMRITFITAECIAFFLQRYVVFFFIANVAEHILNDQSPTISCCHIFRCLVDIEWNWDIRLPSWIKDKHKNKKKKKRAKNVIITLKIIIIEIVFIIGRSSRSYYYYYYYTMKCTINLPYLRKKSLKSSCFIFLVSSMKNKTYT